MSFDGGGGGGGGGGVETREPGKHKNSNRMIIVAIPSGK